MTCWQLAQINIARLIAPLDDPRIAPFIAELDPVNALADHRPGFVWRLQSESGNATGLAYNDDPFVIVNMSVWESLEALRHFTYRGSHMEIFRKRREWVEKMERPHYCLWWVPGGHTPTIAEGRERLEHYQEHGSTPYSFWFPQPFPAPAEAPAVTLMGG